MLKEISGNIIARILNSFFALIIAVIISQTLGSEGRGEQSIIMATISIIVIITGIIGPSSITYLLPRKPFNELFIPSCLWIFIITSISVPFMSILKVININYIYEVCLLIMLISFHNLLTSIFTARQNIKAINIIMILQIVITFILITISFFVLKFKSLHSYFISSIVGYLIANVFGFLSIKNEFSNSFKFSFNINTLKSQFLLGLYNQLANLIQLLNFRYSYFVVDKFIGKGAVGILSNAFSIAESIWVISRSTAIVFHSKIVNMKNIISIRLLTKRIIINSFFILIALNLLLIILPDKIYQILFGSEFINLKKYILPLIPGIIAFGLNIILIYFYSGIGKHHINLISNLGGFLILILGLYLFIPINGILRAILSTNMCYFTVFLINLIVFIVQTKKLK